MRSCQNSKQKRPNTNTCFHDGDIESSQKESQWCFIIPSNNYTRKKTNKKDPPVGFFAPPHPGTIIYPAIWTEKRCFSAPPGGYCEDYRKSICGWTKSIGSEGIHVRLGQKVMGFSGFFVALPHRSLRSFQMFVGSLYEKK